ncbi:MAG TPA: antibiotic biosynthesis monooxygenase family protein [Actinomycetes bacterium]|nr:antibiotic biosynthesis monooxygenase family protein [Actinomycetes bacterium]
MDSVSGWGTVPRLHVVSRFQIQEENTFWGDQLRAAAELMESQVGCDAVTVGRATDDPRFWVLTSEWESVGAYRRALSSFDVKVLGVPVLSTAVDEPSAFEVLYAKRDGRETEATSARAPS